MGQRVFSTILIVDDEPDLVETLVAGFEMAGITAIGTSNPEKVLELVATKSPDALLVDVRMPKLDGYAVLRQVIEKYHSSVPVFLMSAYFDATAWDVYDRGAMGLFIKPFAIDELVARISRIFSGVPSEIGESFAISTRISMVVPREHLFEPQSPVRLGRRGVFVRKGGKLPRQGEHIALTILDKDGSTPIFELVGQVAWTRSDADSAAAQDSGFGLLFMVIEERYRAFLAEEIKKRTPIAVLPAS